MLKPDFNEFELNKNNLVNAMAYSLACLLNARDLTPTNLDWSADYVTEIVDAAQKILEKYEIPTCRPYHRHLPNGIKVPCYKVKDECCNRTDCIYHHSGLYLIK